MGCIGVHFAITPEFETKLIIAQSDEERLELVQQWEEEAFEGDSSFVGETDKAWDAIHRCLADGKLTWSGGEEPMRWAILGGVPMYDGSDYIISYIKSEQVQELAKALTTMTRKDLRRRYEQIDTSTYQGEKNEEDFDYTWNWFQIMQTFFNNAAKAGRAVIFTADQ